MITILDDFHSTKFARVAILTTSYELLTTILTVAACLNNNNRNFASYFFSKGTPILNMDRKF